MQIALTFNVMSSSLKPKWEECLSPNQSLENLNTLTLKVTDKYYNERHQVGMSWDASASNKVLFAGVAAAAHCI